MSSFYHHRVSFSFNVCFCTFGWVDGLWCVYYCFPVFLLCCVFCATCVAQDGWKQHYKGDMNELHDRYAAEKKAEEEKRRGAAGVEEMKS